MTTDIFGMLVEDDAVFDLEIMGRADGETVSTGVIFNIRDLGNVDTQKELKRERNRSLGKRMSKKEALSDEEIGEMMSIATTDPTDAMLAHCVTGWDWGDKTLDKYDLNFSHENVVKVFSGVPWIRSQVLAKVLQITDFTKA